MDTALFAGFAVAYSALLVWTIVLAARRGWWTPANLPMLVVAALVYDNAVLAAGSAIGEGPLLETLSVARFWVHAFVTPLLVVWAWHAVVRTGARWARTTVATVVVLVATAGLIVLEIATVIAGLRLDPVVEYGVLSYSDARPSSGPPLMVLFVAAALIAAGWFVWRHQRWIWLLIGAVIMTIGSAVPIPVDSGAITNAFELILLTSIVATVARQDAVSARERP